MLTSENIKMMASNGEGYNAEFKVNVPLKIRDLAEEVCAFANAVGGFLIIGIDDKNKIRGVDIDNSTRSNIQSVIGNISPSVHTEMYPVDVEDKTVWVIDVTAGKNKPYVFSGSIYLREGSNTQKLTSAEDMRSFFQQTECVFFDEVPCRSFDMSLHLDTEFVNEFKMLAGYHKEISNEHLFNNLKLFTDDGYFKNGAVLFFAKHPEELIDNAFVRCALFDGIDKCYFEDDKRMQGPLFRQYEQTFAWLKKHLKVRYDIEGQGGRPRKEIWEIPEVVMKEALVNALVHRDYYDKGARIVVELYKDRLVVTNPGGLVNSIPPEKFGTISRSRNPLIFGLMERIHMVEYIGSGVMRMRSAMKEAALPQPDFGLKGTFSISLVKQKSELFDEFTEKNELSEIQNKVLALIKENGSITNKELSETLSVSIRNTWRIIKHLKDNGYIERLGANKKGAWILNERVGEPENGTINGTINGIVNGTINGTVNGTVNEFEDDNVLNKKSQNEQFTTQKNELSEIQNKTLALIKENGSITNKELSETLSVSIRNTWRIIKHLKDNGYIARLGANKKGAWILNERVSEHENGTINGIVNGTINGIVK